MEITIYTEIGDLTIIAASTDKVSDVAKTILKAKKQLSSHYYYKTKNHERNRKR